MEFTEKQQKIRRRNDDPSHDAAAAPEIRPDMHGNSISFSGMRTWGNFLRKVSPNPFKNFSTGIKQISSVQFRCIKYCFTNYQKTVRDLVTSAQWDVCPDFLCKKVNAAAPTGYGKTLAKTAKVWYKKYTVKTEFQERRVMKDA